MAEILVVCTGNVCRSPIAQGFLSAALERRLGAAAPRVVSAGTSGWVGSGAMEESVRAAAERGLDISRHVARHLTREDVAQADLILGMAAEHRDVVQHSAPDAAERTFTLKELVRLLDAVPSVERGAEVLGEQLAAAARKRAQGFEGNLYDEDIVDPLGQPLESYRAIAWELEEWTGRLADDLFGAATAAAGASAEEA